MHLTGVRRDRREAVFLFAHWLMSAIADNPTAPAFVRYWRNSEYHAMSAFDP
jgi:hypothetical protein